MNAELFNLTPLTSPGSQIAPTARGGYRLEIPAGRAGPYRLAQLDNYAQLRRADFPYRPGLKFRLKARASSAAIPGTWGFGFWNDPFSTSFLLGRKNLQLPVLPNAAWYFFASPQNYLSLRDDLPARGALAATFQSAQLSTFELLPAAVFLPCLILAPIARLMRRIGRSFITQDSSHLNRNPTEWHDYGIEWHNSGVVFDVDGEIILKTEVSPHPPMGLVIWVDNQYAAALPDGRIRYGRLANHQPAWVEVEQINITEL